MNHAPVSVAAAALPDEAARLHAGLAEIDSPEVRMWHDALDALRAINKLRSPAVRVITAAGNVTGIG